MTKPLPDATLVPFSESVTSAERLQVILDAADDFREALRTVAAAYAGLLDAKKMSAVFEGVAAEVRGKPVDGRLHRPLDVSVFGDYTEKLCACGQPWPCEVKYEPAGEKWPG